jgi:hypothetical protein
MAEEKARVGFSLDLKDTKSQIDDVLKGLNDIKSGFKQTGQDGTASVNKLNLGLKSVFKNITAMSTGLRKSLSEGSKLSRKQLNELLVNSKNLEERLSSIHSKTAQKVEQSEGKKQQAYKKTLKEQEKAIKSVGKLGSATSKSIKETEKSFLVLESIVTVKLASTFRNLTKEATLLAARNEVLGTAMKTVGNNAGISNAELERSEVTIRKLGISINDTRELISRFAQAQLGMDNATRLARAAQDLAAGSTLGSSEALRIMTQSILSLLPRQLRQFGVVVNLNQVYKEQSRILKKSVNDLTSLEKRQGLLNKIFEEAAKRTGAYERSMQDTGKVLTTLTSRIIPDTLSAFGDQLLPVFEDLVFAVKNLLESLRDLPPNVKLLISAVTTGVTIILSLKAALVLLGGTLGFVKAGFAGAAVTASAFSASLGPLIIGIGALVAAWIVAKKAFSEANNEQDKLVDSSQKMLNMEIERLDSLRDLKEAVENQAATEEDLRKIVDTNVKRHKALLPLLQKETLSRKDILKVLDIEISKRQEAVDVALEQTRTVSKEQLESFKDQKRNVNLLVEELDKLITKYGEGNIPIRTLVSSIQRLRGEIESSGRSTEGLSDQLDIFFKGTKNSVNDLLTVSSQLGVKIRNVSQNIEQDFGLAAKGVQKNASDMTQAFLELDSRLDKLTAKTTKKFPFKALIEEQEKFSQDLDKAIIADDKRNELMLKAQDVFHKRFATAELKFREKLESIGATDLQKIEAKRRKEIEVNQGSAVAVQAIEKEAAFARNAVFTKMWDDRLTITKDGVETIAEVIRFQRDLAIQNVQRDTNVRIAEARLTADELVQIRIEESDRILQIIKTTQDEEFSVRKIHFDAVASQISMLYSRGVINQQQFNERTKALALELKDFRQAQLAERVVATQSALNQLVAVEKGAVDRIKAIGQEKVNAIRSTESTIRQLRQQGLEEIDVFNEERARADDLLSEGQRALHEGDFDRVKEINQEIKSIALATSKEIRETSDKDSKVLINADKARIGSIKLVETAGALLQQAFEAQRSAEVSALSQVQDKIFDLEQTLKSLTDETREIEVKLIGEAEKQIAKIKQNLDKLKDKTVTVTIRTNNVSVGGSSPGTEGTGQGAAAGGPVPAEASVPGFARGSVDVQGPGTNASDSIVAMLSRGESVITATATRMFKPLLELMNANPEQLRQILATNIRAGQTAGASSVNNQSTEFGDLILNFNGVDASDIRNRDWRKTAREEIWPELQKLIKRKSFI